MAKKRNSQYWQRRIEEQSDKAYKRTNAETEKELSRIYTQTRARIYQDIVDLYAHITEKKPEDYTISDFYRNQRYWDWHKQMNKLLTSLGSKQIAIQSPQLTALYYLTQQIIDKHMPFAPISLTTGQRVASVASNANAVSAKTLLDQTWCLDGKHFSDRVWEDKNKMMKALEEELQKSILQGKHPLDGAQQVAERLNVSEYNATRLMRTESAHIQIQAKVDKYKEYGITQGRFISSSGCCDECSENNGRLYPLEQLPQILPAHPNCRCSFGAVV